MALLLGLFSKEKTLSYNRRNTDLYTFSSKEIGFLNIIMQEHLTFLAACLLTSLASF